MHWNPDNDLGCWWSKLTLICCEVDGTTNQLRFLKHWRGGTGPCQLACERAFRGCKICESRCLEKSRSDAAWLWQVEKHGRHGHGIGGMGRIWSRYEVQSWSQLRTVDEVPSGIHTGATANSPHSGRFSHEDIRFVWEFTGGWPKLRGNCGLFGNS
jgi:hypothetical protein